MATVGVKGLTCHLWISDEWGWPWLQSANCANFVELSRSVGMQGL